MDLLKELVMRTTKRDEGSENVQHTGSAEQEVSTKLRLPLVGNVGVGRRPEDEFFDVLIPTQHRTITWCRLIPANTLRRW
jgi:hypothetical protein